MVNPIVEGKFEVIEVIIMKFCFVTAKVAFFLLLFSFWGCSEDAEDLTPKDYTPPTVTSVNISEGEEIEPPFQIVINFSEAINIASLYRIQISGLSSRVEGAGSAVLVKIPEGAKPGRYTLVISGVEDLTGNTMGVATTISFLIPSPPPPKEEPEKKLIDIAIPIANENFIVPAGNFHAIKFEVTDDMVNPIVDGKFEVLVGVDVEVWLFSEIDFKNWKARIKPDFFWFHSGRVAAGKIENLGRFPPGTHYLVLDNTFSWFTKKKVQVKVELKYSKWM